MIRPIQPTVDATLDSDDWNRIGLALLVGVATAVGHAAVDFVYEKVRDRFGGEDAPGSVVTQPTATTANELNALHTHVQALEAELAMLRRIAELENELSRLREPRS